MSTELTILIWFHQSVCVFGVAANVLLSMLVIFRTPNSMRTYSILILNLALTDMCTCFTDLMVQARMIPAGDILSIISEGVCKYLGSWWCFLFFTLQLHFLSHALYLLLISFIYRYYILIKDPPTVPFLQFIIFIFYIPSFIHVILELPDRLDPKEVSEVVNRLHPQYDLNATNVAINGHNIHSLSTVYSTLHLTVPMFPIYIIILILRRKIIKHLRLDLSHMRRQTRRMHFDLLQALTVQVMLPVMSFLAIITFELNRFSIVRNSEVLESSTFAIVVFVPAISPIIALYYIRPYREVVQNWVCRKNKVTSNYDGSQTRFSFAESSKY